MNILTELLISHRYIYASKGSSFSTFTSSISIIGTALAVAILLCIMSIMNGFEQELKNRTLRPGSHLEVQVPHKFETRISEYLEVINADYRVQDTSYITEGQVLAAAENVFRTVTLRGLDSNDKFFVEVLSRNLVAGSLDKFSERKFGIVVGEELADSLGVGVGNFLPLVVPSPRISPVGLMTRNKRFEVIGVFKFGLQEPDSKLVFVHNTDLKIFLPKMARQSLIAIRLWEVEDAAVVAESVRSATELRVIDWKDSHKALFRALKVEKLVMFVILFMAVVIAVLNMASILLVSVISKRKDIAILVSLGMSREQIMRIFFYQGAFTGLIGVGIGLFGGAMLSYYIDSIVELLESFIGFKVLSPDLYYISSIPSRLFASDIVLLGGVSLLSVFLAPIGPALLAAKMNPTKGLRCE